MRTSAVMNSNEASFLAPTNKSTSKKLVDEWNSIQSAVSVQPESSCLKSSALWLLTFLLAPLKAYFRCVISSVLDVRHWTSFKQAKLARLGSLDSWNLFQFSIFSSVSNHWILLNWETYQETCTLSALMFIRAYLWGLKLVFLAIITTVSIIIIIIIALVFAF